MLDLARQYAHMKEEIDAAITRCLEHQRWIFGPEVGELEDRMSSYLGIANCIGTSSGTEALVLALRALAIVRRDEEYWSRESLVITTAFTFTATGDAILRSGATPLFVDIDPVSFNLDPVAVRSAIDEHGEKVVGIMPVHLYGQGADMDAIMSIADERGLFVVEDVAQAFGAEAGGRRLGAVGTAGAFSFFPSKNLGGFGDGGMLSTNDSTIADVVRMLIKHGGRDKYNVDHIGYNARLDTLQAAVLLVRLVYIDEFNSKRRAIAARYSDALASVSGVTTPAFNEGSSHVFHQYTLRVSNRDSLQAALKERGVSSMVYYPHPLHKMKVFGTGRSIVPAGGLPESERAATEVLSLPMEPLQDEATTETVICALRDSVA